MKKILLLATIVLFASSAFADEAKLRVFVTHRVDSSREFVHEPQQNINSVKDIVSRLTKRDMKKMFVMVDSAEKADLVVEIYQTDQNPLNLGSNTTVSYSQNYTSIRTREMGWNTKVVRAELKVVGSDYVTDISGASSDWLWSSAAWSVAANLRDWTKQNEERLTSRANRER